LNRAFAPSFITRHGRFQEHTTEGENMDSVTIPIRGMTCGGCVANVERVLKQIDGVESVSVSLDPGEARVEYVPGRVNLAHLRSAIEDAGYEVER
jgi:copper ion binding protein